MAERERLVDPVPRYPKCPTGIMMHAAHGLPQPLARTFGPSPRGYAVPTVRELPQRWSPLAEREIFVPPGIDAPGVRRPRSGA
jgi:hypothetical protein